MFHRKESLLSLLLLPAAHAATPSCASLAHSFKFENTTVTGAELVKPLTNFTVFGVGGCPTSAVSGNLTVCRVQLTTNTTSTSSVRMEAWLPNPEDWQGRFLGLGNSGLNGCECNPSSCMYFNRHQTNAGIDYLDLPYGTSLSFATISSNNGHDGNSGSVFLNSPEVINDFAFRAVHTEALVGKALVKAYYGKPQKKSYFLGCSTGGRQGLKEAEMFPEDFDGILGGAPVQDFNHLLGWLALLSIDGGAPEGSANARFIDAETWPIISAEIMRQCDGLDGVIDQTIVRYSILLITLSKLLTSHNRPNQTNASSVQKL